MEDKEKTGNEKLNGQTQNSFITTGNQATQETSLIDTGNQAVDKTSYTDHGNGFVDL